MAAKRTKVDAAWKTELKHMGYVVLPSVITVDQCKGLESQIFSFLEGLHPGFNRSDRSTWKASNLPIRTNSNLIQHYNAGLQRFNVDARMLVKHIFEELFGTSKLTCSFDGVSFTAKGYKAECDTVYEWRDRAMELTRVHVDQTTLDVYSIQGGLAITDQKEDEQVFVCIPGSHLYLKELLALGPEKKTLHWEMMNPAQLKFLHEKGFRMIRVPVNRGDFILWNSALVHASAKPCKTADPMMHRMHIFISMAPAMWSEKEQQTRQKAYDEGRVSKHSADKIRLFDKTPRIFNSDQKKQLDECVIPKSTPMTLEEKQLHGLVPYLF